MSNSLESLFCFHQWEVSIRDLNEEHCQNYSNEVAMKLGRGRTGPTQLFNWSSFSLRRPSNCLPEASLSQESVTYLAVAGSHVSLFPIFAFQTQLVQNLVSWKALLSPS
jgi:hypothetical protein